MSVVFSGYSGFLHQQNWPPWYILKVALSIITLTLTSRGRITAVFMTRTCFQTINHVGKGRACGWMYNTEGWNFTLQRTLTTTHSNPFLLRSCCQVSFTCNENGILYSPNVHLHPILRAIQRGCTLHSRKYVLFLYAGIPLGVVLADHRYIVQWRC